MKKEELSRTENKIVTRINSQLRTFGFYGGKLEKKQDKNCLFQGEPVYKFSIKCNTDDYEEDCYYLYCFTQEHSRSYFKFDPKLTRFIQGKKVIRRDNRNLTSGILLSLYLICDRLNYLVFRNSSWEDINND